MSTIIVPVGTGLIYRAQEHSACHHCKVRVKLRSGCSLTDAIKALEGVLSGASDYRPHVAGPVHQYTMFCAESGRILRNALSDKSARELIVTSRYLAAGSVQPVAAAIVMIEDDLDDLKRALIAALDELKGSQTRWKDGAVFVVPDANVFLHHQKDFDQIDWHAELAAWPLHDPTDEVRVVIPMIVVDQLDNLKRDHKRKTRARTSIKCLDALLPTSPHVRTVVQPRISGKSADVTVEVLVDDLDHVRLDDSDSEIVDRALMLQQLAGRPVVLMTADHGMVFRARSVGLAAVALDLPD